MLFSRVALGSWVLLALVTAAGCGGESDSKTSGTAGSGASAGTSGSSSGGSAGTTGGSSGTAAKGGSGGTSVGGSSGTGGTTPKGGSGGTMSGGSAGMGDPIDITTSDCPSFEPCGGDLVGSWKVTAVCGSASSVASGVPDCTKSTQTGSGDVIYTFTSDGMRTVSGAVSVDATGTIDDACAMSAAGVNATTLCTVITLAQAGGSLGTDFTDFTCKVANGECQCHIATVPNDVSATGTYTTMNGQLTIDTDAPVDYCITGDTLQIAGSDGSVTTLERQ